MIDLCVSNPEECSGCSACASICPQEAITMTMARNGFLYPIIDEQKCVECGLCKKTCDFKIFKPTGTKPSCYAVKHIDEDEVSTSRSGAFFMALCQYVIENNGVVFGAELNNNLNCIHKRETAYHECRRFKGSKYVQSNPGLTFKECANDLRQGRLVCYSGTGCQVHGLLRYLDNTRVPVDNLITVDIVCHGVPSPGVWEKYILALQKKTKSKVVRVDFRDKSINGWADHIETYHTEDGLILKSKSWTDCFYRHILFRESCFSCKYTTTERKTDFTIADYWGIGKNVPEFDDNKGCSLVLAHNEKAEEILNQISNKIIIKRTNLENSLQPQLKKPTWRGWDYKLFWNLYYKDSNATIRKFFFPTKTILLMRKIEKHGKQLIKKLKAL